MTEFKTGQKWISNAEPELGVGRIIKTEHRFVTIQFNLVDETRVYARDQAPISRVRFRVGDTIRTADGVELAVEDVGETDGILVYTGDYLGTRTSLIESDLDPNIIFSSPEERLFTHQLDNNRRFVLRYRTLQAIARQATSPVRGLQGPRVALIPHQFYIANEVAQRHAPRVLLADEVGLGKTIEAGLIIHQQLTTGRAARVLIIVPQALTFQWFVEMIRRFNLQFTIMDEDRCVQIESDIRPEAMDEFDDADDAADFDDFNNPFEAQQLMLCSINLFTDNPERLEQALDAEWDLVVVDEAHHLTWHDDEPGEDYLAVEALGHVSPGLLLLTATPEQLGQLGHFGRLRLLDPDRYHSFEAFKAEEAEYSRVADLLPEQLDQLDEATVTAIRTQLGQYAPDNDDELVTALLDRHGTGRVLFRNVRESVAGFPERRLVSHELDAGTFPVDLHSWDRQDPRINWLIDLVDTSDDKFLVICARAETAITLERYLREKTTLRSAAFHEGMDLVARDRAANYFADTEKGAQVMICSEIGSEGRNFQFAHQLVMYDLPDNPDLLEQRIGRLDRIGQRHDVTIHVPWAAGTHQALLMKIYDEGLGIFTAPNPAAQAVFEQVDLTQDPDAIVSQVKELSQARLSDLRNGRDRLVELNSHRPEVSDNLLSELIDLDLSSDLEDYMEASFAAFGLESEPLADRLMMVKPSDSIQRHEAVSVETLGRARYPELPEEGTTYTFHRQTALAREDVLYLTWESPMVQEALDLVKSDVTGNATVVVLKLKGVPAGTLMTETLHRVECVAPTAIGADRFLPPRVIRSLITPELRDLGDNVPFTPWNDHIKVPRDAINKIITQQEDGIRRMLEAAEARAGEKFAPLRDDAHEKMDRQLRQEIQRMEALAAVNPNVRSEEIDFLKDSQTALGKAITESRVALEAVRIIIAA